MSKIGKACLLISGLFVLASGVVRLILNTWHDSLYVSFGLALVFFTIAIVKDFRTYIEFFTMRTTKHGMNMGALILIALVFLVSINFIAVKKDKKFDWTAEGLNSLSDQSVKAAKAIEDELKIVLLSHKEQQEEPVRRVVQGLAQMYRDENSKISFVPYNARQRPDLAKKYGFSAGAFGVFLEYKGKQMKVEVPAGAAAPSEEDLTKALIKIARDQKKTLYFTQGRGEHPLDAGPRDPYGLSLLKEDLETLYTVKPLNLVDSPKVPEDAVAVVIAGPRQQFLPTELEILRSYVHGGGSLLIAADPGTDHNLAQLTKTFGVEFQNNYVLDPRAAIPGRGNVAALGSSFSKSSDITKDFQSGSIAVFELASALSKAPDAPEELVIDEIVKTDEMPIVSNGLTEAELRRGRQGQQVALGISVTGRLPEAKAETATPAEDAKKAAKNFSVVIFGDSDFMTNGMYRGYLNRDMAMNSVAMLASDTEMISIRPKVPKGSVLQLTRDKVIYLLIGFLIPLPILMFGSGGFIWWRRRTA